MIVRIVNEGQYRIPDGDAGGLNDLDNAAVAAVEAGDEGRFHELFAQMLELVRTHGAPLEIEELIESDVLLPPPDTTFAEATADFTGDGLIPG